MSCLVGYLSSRFRVEGSSSRFRVEGLQVNVMGLGFSLGVGFSLGPEVVVLEHCDKGVVGHPRRLLCVRGFPATQSTNLHT